MMRIATTLLLLHTFPAGVMAQEEWYLKMKPTQSHEMGWAFDHGVGFSIGEYVIFGMGQRNNFEMSSAFRKYHPATNTFAPFEAGMMEMGIPIANAGAGGVAFAIGEVGYVGLGGSGGSVANDSIFRYTLAEDHFWAMNPIVFPGGRRFGAIAFVVNGKAYIGGGQSTQPGTYYNDLWEYTPGTGWSQRANMPAAISGGAAFALGGFGYVQRQNSTNFWRYDPVADAWSAMAPYPGGARQGAVAFTYNGKGVVGTGLLAGNQQKNFFAYDPGMNTWTEAAPMWDPWGRYQAVAVSHGDKAYVIGGKAGQYGQRVAEIWALGPPVAPVPGAWVQRPYLPAVPRSRPISFVIGKTAFLGGGNTTASTWLTDFWAYDAEARKWTSKAALPGIAQIGLALAGKGYVLLNTATGNFWQYDPQLDQWTAKANMPGGARTLTSGFVAEERIFIGTGFVGGVRMRDLWAYDPATDAWEAMTDLPPSAVHSAAGFSIGNKGYIVGGNISGSSTATWMLREYDPAHDSWIVRAALYNVQNHMAFSIGNIGYVAGGAIGGTPLNNFRSYDPATQSWTTEVVTGGGWRYNGAGFSVGGRGFIACGFLNPDFPNSGERINDLWEFVPEVIAVAPKVLLAGPYDQNTGLMDVQLNTLGLLPATDPYAALAYPLPGGDYSNMGHGIPNNTGNDAIVDRVIVELRNGSDPATVMASRHVWLQRDGDVVDMDGVSPIRFTMPPGNYHVAIRHRNHLGCMTAAPIALSATPTTINLTSSATPTWGTDARKNVDGTMVLWPGDATFDGVVKYVGAANDRDPILTTIGGNTPSNVVSNVYHSADHNMDGQVKYVGAANDRDIILQTIGGGVSTAVRAEQVP